MNILFWIIGIIASLFGIQTMRIEKAKKKTKEAESQLVYEQARLKREQQATKAKDLLLQKQKEQVKIKEENIVKIGKTEDLPHDEKVEEQQEIVDNLTDLFNSRNRTL